MRISSQLCQRIPFVSGCSAELGGMSVSSVGGAGLLLFFLQAQAPRLLLWGDEELRVGNGAGKQKRRSLQQLRLCHL